MSATNSLSVLATKQVTVDLHGMSELGKALASSAAEGSVIYLHGTLGMGKTTLSRAIVQALGWPGKVKSPTYTLVEQYDLSGLTALHLDLYRLSDPEELEFLGVRDFDQLGWLWLIEWPEKGEGVLPGADLLVKISSEADEHRRIVQLDAITTRGQKQLIAVGISEDGVLC